MKGIILDGKIGLELSKKEWNLVCDKCNIVMSSDSFIVDEIVNISNYSAFLYLNIIVSGVRHNLQLDCSNVSYSGERIIIPVLAIDKKIEKPTQIKERKKVVLAKTRDKKASNEKNVISKQEKVINKQAGCSLNPSTMKIEKTFNRFRINDSEDRKRVRINKDVVTFYFYSAEEIKKVIEREEINLLNVVDSIAFQELIKESKIFRRQIGICLGSELIMHVSIESLPDKSVVAKIRIIDVYSDKYLKPTKGKIENNKTYQTVKAIPISSLQLIRSSGNHATVGHPVEDRVILIKYYNWKKNKEEYLELAGHYCLKCNKYFDYYGSFTQQLMEKAIFLKDLKIYVEDVESITGDSRGLKLSAQSLLAKRGYAVGKNGVYVSHRRRILDACISNKELSIAEIKSHLEWLVKFNGKKVNMSDAVKDWNTDIEYLNGLIKKNKR